MLAPAADPTFSHYAPVGVLLLIAIGFAVMNLILPRLLAPSREGPIKGGVYESGVDPIGSARQRFNVRFYIVAVTFLLFDVEIVFLYPWATVFPSLSPDSDFRGMFLARVLFFIFTSVVAFVYAWRKGVFRYD
jgi:NADH-quinone oxidoreductase subunit A